jgi:hypothetical protein
MLILRDVGFLFIQIQKGKDMLTSTLKYKIKRRQMQTRSGGSHPL